MTAAMINVHLAEGATPIQASDLINYLGDDEIAKELQAIKDDNLAVAMKFYANWHAREVREGRAK